jgi:hypothetical protein
MKAESTQKAVGDRVRSRRQERLEARRKGLVKSGRMPMTVEGGKKEKKLPIRVKRGGAFAKKDNVKASASQPSKVSFLSKAVRDALGKKIKYFILILHHIISYHIILHHITYSLLLMERLICLSMSGGL